MVYAISVLCSKNFDCAQEILEATQDRALQEAASLKQQLDQERIVQINVENQFRMQLDDQEEMIKVLVVQVIVVVQVLLFIHETFHV